MMKKTLVAGLCAAMAGIASAGSLSYDHVEAGFVSLDNGDENGVFFGAMRKLTPDVFAEFQLDYSDFTKATAGIGYELFKGNGVSVDLHGGLEYFDFEHGWGSQSESGAFLGLRARKAIGNGSEFSVWLDTGTADFFKGSELGLRTDFSITAQLKGVISYEIGFNDRDYDTFRLGVRYQF